MNGHARHWIDGDGRFAPGGDNPSTRPAASRSAPTPTAGGPRPMRRSPPLCAPSKMVPGRTTMRCARQPWRKSPRLRAACRWPTTCLPWRTARSSPRLLFDTAWPGKLRYYAGLARQRTAPAARRAPTWCRWCCASRVGVAGIIVPWNSPVVLMTPSAPALAAGTTTVVKMPGQTAQTNALVARSSPKPPSLPAGTVNIFGFRRRPAIDRRGRGAGDQLHRLERHR